MKTIFNRIALFATTLVLLATGSMMTSCTSSYADDAEIETHAGRSGHHDSALSVDGQEYYIAESGSSCREGLNGTFEFKVECYSKKWMTTEGWCYKDKQASKYNIRMSVAAFDVEAASYGQKLDVVAAGTMVTFYSNAEGKSRYFVFEDNQPKGAVTFVSFEDGMLTVNLSGVKLVCQNATTGEILDDCTINGTVTMMAY